MLLGLRLLSTVLAMLIVGASIFRSQGWFIHDIYWAQEWLGGDKATHFWGGACLMLCGALWSSAWRSWRRYLVAVTFIFAALVMEEYSQQWLSSRSFSWLDMASTITGASIISLLVLIVLITVQLRQE